MATLVQPNLEVRLKESNDVGIPSGYVLVQTAGAPIRVAFDLIGEVPPEMDEHLRRSVVEAVRAESANHNLHPTRIYLGA